MSDTSPVLSLPFIQPSQAQKHVTHNEAIAVLDVLVQAAVTARALTAPPAAPAVGARYIVAEGATDGWAGHDHAIAWWPEDSQGWQFLTPLAGWRVHDLETGEDVVWTGSAWAVAGGTIPQFAQLGVATAADDTNRLAVASAAVLFTHAGAGQQIKVNKATASDTASLLFQDNWSGRAEMGIVGSDDFAIKVSADGADFVQALRVARATGVVTLPQGAVVNGALGGSAVQATATDATAGRLLTVGAFGLGAGAALIGNAGAVDGSIAPGLYGYDTTAGSSGGPAAAVRGCLLHIRHDGAGETQALFVLSGSSDAATAGAIFSRARTTGGWGDWRPAGVIENTANAQGRYRRDQDGTLTCWQTVTTLTTAELSVTFPAVFATTTGMVTTLGVNSATVGAVVPRFTGRSVTGLSLSAFNTSNARVAASIDLVTTGRWF